MFTEWLCKVHACGGRYGLETPRIVHDVEQSGGQTWFLASSARTGESGRGRHHASENP